MLSPKILYEDNCVIAVEKDAGILVHDGDFSNEETILDWLLYTYSWANSIENKYKLQNKIINLSGISHRLDRDTSGILLIAKDQNTLEKLRNSFHSGKVEKEYMAMIHGQLSKEQTIKTPLGREKKGFKRLPEGDVLARGPFMTAETIVIPLSCNIKTDTSLVKLLPKTGRTHQLRAHLSFINHPIIGDKLYGTNEDKKENRLYLHANSISIPFLNLTINSPAPVEFSSQQ